jgi:hypothetical protein
MISAVPRGGAVQPYWSSCGAVAKIRVANRVECLWQSHAVRVANDRQAAVLLAAFPPEVREDALAAVEVMPPDKTWETVGSVGEFRIQLEGETVTIPERIYNAEPKGVQWLRVGDGSLRIRRMPCTASTRVTTTAISGSAT